MFHNKVKDIMTKKVISVSKDSSFFEVASLMAQNDIGFVPIVEGERIIGVITDRDMVIRGITNREDSNASIGKYMTQEVVFVKPNTPIEAASRLMADRQIKRLLVIDDGTLVGVLSLSDITNHNHKKAMKALAGIQKKHKKNYFSDNPEVDEFKL